MFSRHAESAEPRLLTIPTFRTCNVKVGARHETNALQDTPAVVPCEHEYVHCMILYNYSVHSMQFVSMDFIDNHTDCADGSDEHGCDGEV